MLNSQEVTSFISIYPFRIRTVSALFVVTMYNYHPRRLAKSNIEKQYFSHCVNDVCNGSPSRILRVLLISFGMTIRPKSSTRRTMPVAFILSSPLKRSALDLHGSSICRKRGIMYDSTVIFPTRYAAPKLKNAPEERLKHCMKKGFLFSMDIFCRIW